MQQKNKTSATTYKNSNCKSICYRHRTAHICAQTNMNMSARNTRYTHTAAAAWPQNKHINRPLSWSNCGFANSIIKYETTKLVRCALHRIGCEPLVYALFLFFINSLSFGISHFSVVRPSTGCCLFRLLLLLLLLSSVSIVFSHRYFIKPLCEM